MSFSKPGEFLYEFGVEFDLKDANDSTLYIFNSTVRMRKLDT